MSKGTTTGSPYDDDDDDVAVDPTDELLVSYLDGELGEVERIELEERLIREESLRARLSSLQSGWEMLDCLPQATVSGDFARTTVEMLAAAQSQSVAIVKRQQNWFRSLWVAALAVTSVVALIAGWYFPRVMAEIQLRSELRDLPLAENLDAYLINVDLATIEELSEQERWQRAMQVALDAGGIIVPASLEFGQRERNEQVQLLGRLEHDAQSKLATNWNRLTALPADRLQLVRERHEAISKLDHPREILGTLIQYAAWWNQLSPESRDRIVRADDNTRIPTILELVERSSRNWVQNYANTLGETDRTLIYQRLLLIAWDRIDAAIDYSDEQGVTIRAVGGDPRWRELSPNNLLDRIAYRDAWMFRERRRTGVESGAGQATGGPPANVSRSGSQGTDVEEERRVHGRLLEILYSTPSTEELIAVEQVMSHKALAILGAETVSVEERQQTLWRWCVEIILQAARGSDGEVALNRYESLDEDYRDSLDLKEPEKLLNELQERRFRPW